MTTNRTRSKRKPAQDKGQEMTTKSQQEALDNGWEMTTEQAQEFLQAQNKLRAEQAKAEIEKILEQYKCQINAYPLINVEGRIVATADIVAV